MKQVLLSILWIIAGTLLGSCLAIFDGILAFETQFELLASLSWGSVGLLFAALLAEGLIFWLSAKTKTIAAGMISLLVCLTLVWLGIEISGFPDVHYAGTDRFSRLVYHRPWYKISILVLFFLPLLFWGYHGIKHRRESNKRVEQEVRADLT